MYLPVNNQIKLVTKILTTFLVAIIETTIQLIKASFYTYRLLLNYNYFFKFYLQLLLPNALPVFKTISEYDIEFFK